jgi:hypothetical protein
VAWAADVAAAEARGAEVQLEDEDSATVEDAVAGAALGVVEAFLVEAHPGVVAEAVSAGGAHRLIYTILWWVGVRIYHKAFWVTIANAKLRLTALHGFVVMGRFIRNNDAWS